MTYDRLAESLRAMADVAHRVAPPGAGIISAQAIGVAARLRLTEAAFDRAFDGEIVTEAGRELSAVLDGVTVFCLQGESQPTPVRRILKAP